MRKMSVLTRKMHTSNNIHINFNGGGIGWFIWGSLQKALYVAST
jgi:hypothetical protein